MAAARRFSHASHASHASPEELKISARVDKHRHPEIFKRALEIYSTELLDLLEDLGHRTKDKISIRFPIGPMTMKSHATKLMKYYGPMELCFVSQYSNWYNDDDDPHVRVCDFYAQRLIEWLHVHQYRLSVREMVEKCCLHDFRTCMLYMLESGLCKELLKDQKRLLYHVTHKYQAYPKFPYLDFLENFGDLRELSYSDLKITPLSSKSVEFMEYVHSRVPLKSRNLDLAISFWLKFPKRPETVELDDILRTVIEWFYGHGITEGDRCSKEMVRGIYDGLKGPVMTPIMM